MLKLYENHRPIFVLLAAVTIFLVKIILGYSFYSLGEVWFDEGINFYYAAQKYGFFRNILIDDASYLSLIPRIITIITVKLFHADLYFPQIFKIANIFIATLLISLLLMEEFDDLFGSFWVRLFVVLLIVFFPHVDMYNSTNSPYANIIGVIWFLSFLGGQKKYKFGFFVSLFYFLIIPIIFIAKPLISFAAIPILMFVIWGKITTKHKDYAKLFFTCEA